MARRPAAVHLARSGNRWCSSECHRAIGRFLASKFVEDAPPCQSSLHKEAPRRGAFEWYGQDRGTQDLRLTCRETGELLVALPVATLFCVNPATGLLVSWKPLFCRAAASFDAGIDDPRRSHCAVILHGCRHDPSSQIHGHCRPPRQNPHACLARVWSDRAVPDRRCVASSDSGRRATSFMVRIRR